MNWSNLNFYQKLGLFFLILTFSYSLSDKLINFQQFSVNIYMSPLISDDYFNLVRFGVIVLEASLLALLIIFPSKFISHCLSFFVTTLFTIYYLVFYLLTDSNSCGCGKLFESLGFFSHLIFVNIPLIIISIYFVLSYESSSAKLKMKHP